MKERIIKEVHLVFENLEYIILDKNMFDGLFLENVHNSYYVNCFHVDPGTLREEKSCSSFSINILESGMNKLCAFLERDKPLKNRLTNSDDMSHIHLYFEDGEEEYIALPWDWKSKGCEYHNRFQKTEFLKSSISVTVSPINILEAA